MSNPLYRHFYKTRLWLDLRDVQIKRYPLCARCEREDRLTPATEVHHKVAHRGSWDLFNDANNLESLCAPCHSRTEQSIERRGYDKGVGSDGWPADDRHPLNGGDGIAPWGYSIPWGVQRVMAPVVLVCGPPASGKSTLVGEESGPYDRTIDLDEILVGLGYDRYTQNSVQLHEAMQYRDAAILDLADLPARLTAWLIVGAPTREERDQWRAALGNVSVRIIRPPRSVCIRRIGADPERRRSARALVAATDEWFRRFTP